MPFPPNPRAANAAFIKTSLASNLRERILAGELQPGDIISETRWAPILGAAQASVREAINLLVAEGLVRKEAGRSARVTRLTEADVAQAYQVRAVLEGLACRLLATRKVDISPLDRLIAEMKNAASRNNLRAAIEFDLSFHLRLAELSGNAFLAQQARQLLIPVFAFTMIRAIGGGSPAQAWVDAVDDHLLMLAAIRSGDPQFAEQTARHAIGKFVAVAHEVWAAELPPAKSS